MSLAAALGAAAACSLNPQPLPPDTSEDSGVSRLDSGRDGNTGFGDSGTFDATTDAGPPPIADAAVDAGDASDATVTNGEAGLDASDASDGFDDAAQGD